MSMPGKAKFKAYTRDDTEIYVLGSDLSVRAYGVGILEATLPQGMYKIRMVRGATASEKLIDLQEDLEEYVSIDPLTAIAPIGPVYGSSAFGIEQLAERATNQAKEVDPSSRTGSIVLVLAHCNAEELTDPLTELVFYRWLEMSVQARPGAQPLREKIGDEWWTAWAIIVPAGTYQLELGGGSLRQTVLVAEKFATRIFIRRTGNGTAGETTVRHRALTEISIQMAAPGQAVVYDDHYETIEIARRALESERPIIVHDRLVDQLLQGNWHNPIMGLTGTQLFLAALERDQANRTANLTTKRTVDLNDHVRDKAAKTLREMFSNLEKVLDLGSGSVASDLIALQLRATPFTGDESYFGEITDPPMFWASWQTLIDCSVPSGRVLIARELFSRVAQSYPSGPYLGWRSARRTKLSTKLVELIARSNTGANSSPVLASIAPFFGLASIAPFVGLAAGQPTKMALEALQRRLDEGNDSERMQEITLDLAGALGAPLSLFPDSMTTYLQSDERKLV